MSYRKRKIKWINPINFATLIADNYQEKSWFFLYSPDNGGSVQKKSIIAIFEKNRICGRSLNVLRPHLSAKSRNYENSYFGYVNYEYKNIIVKSFLDKNNSNEQNENFVFINYSLILEFDHAKKTLTAFFEDELYLNLVKSYKKNNYKFSKLKISNLISNFSSSQYLDSIGNIKEMIANGDFYQANLTRKFYGNVNKVKHYDYFRYFKKLVEENSGSYSSFIKIDEKYIISGSPELFLRCDDSFLLSRPIKGTIKRSVENIDDRNLVLKLKRDQKEKAENLMIVDLVRNDFSRVCVAGSVKVKNLFKITTYKTLHHMSSDVIGKISKNKDVIDAFNSCFPPGSMTGAPKIKSMEILEKIENKNRGIYSGAIGFFKDLNNANFSVVIRTIICHNEHFEFQVGGAITYESKPLSELNETFIKAKAICKILNIKNLEKI